jgi:yeast amino acid transporter
VGLAQDGNAPRIFSRATDSGVPYFAVAFTAAFGLLGFINESNSGGQVFNWFIDITGVAGFISWTCIGISHIAFMRALKARGVSRDTLPYKAMLQPFFTWYGIIFNIIIILTQGFTAFMPWDTASFFADYVSLILFVILYVGHKLVYRTKFVKPIEADLDTGRKEIEEMYFEEVKPTTWWGKFWAWVG